MAAGTSNRLSIERRKRAMAQLRQILLPSPTTRRAHPDVDQPPISARPPTGLVEPRQPSEADRPRWTRAFAGSVLAALVLWLIIAALSPGYRIDVESNKIRTWWITWQGIENVYSNPLNQVDHPPLTLYVYDLVGHLYQALVDPSFAINRAMKSQLLTWLIKLPAVLFHLATAAVVFVLVRRFASERRAWLAGTILLFDPAALMNIAHRGTFD